MAEMEAARLFPACDSERGAAAFLCLRFFVLTATGLGTVTGCKGTWPEKPSGRLWLVWDVRLPPSV